MTDVQKIDRHPPADRRCQIYVSPDELSRELSRCINTGTHWEEWGGCCCATECRSECDDVFYSWECDGQHITQFREAA